MTDDYTPQSRNLTDEQVRDLVIDTTEFLLNREPALYPADAIAVCVRTVMVNYVDDMGNTALEFIRQAIEYALDGENDENEVTGQQLATFHTIELLLADKHNLTIETTDLYGDDPGDVPEDLA